MSTFVDHNLGVREGQRDGQIVGGAAHIFHTQKKREFSFTCKSKMMI